MVLRMKANAPVLFLLQFSIVVKAANYILQQDARGFLYSAPPIPLGYQPPPSGPLVDEYPPQPIPSQQQQFYPAQPQQSQLTMIRYDNSQQQQQQFSQFHHESSQQFVNHQQPVSLPVEPLLINTLIQVYSNKDEHLGPPDATRVSLSEAHMVSSVNRDKNNLGGHVNTQPSIYDGRKRKVEITRQLNTHTGQLVHPGTHSNSEAWQADANPENVVNLKAFSATNSSKISNSELETELNKELEHSIPLIIDELDKVTKKKLATNPAVTNLPTTITTTINPLEHIKTKDLEKLIEEGLAEIGDPNLKNQLQKAIDEAKRLTASSSTSTSATPTIPTTTPISSSTSTTSTSTPTTTSTSPSTTSSSTIMSTPTPKTSTTTIEITTVLHTMSTIPLIIFTKASPPPDTTPVPTTTSNMEHGTERIPEAEETDEPFKKGEHWAPSTTPTGIPFETLIVDWQGHGNIPTTILPANTTSTTPEGIPTTLEGLKVPDEGHSIGFNKDNEDISSVATAAPHIIPVVRENVSSTTIEPTTIPSPTVEPATISTTLVGDSSTVKINEPTVIAGSGEEKTSVVEKPSTTKSVSIHETTGNFPTLITSVSRTTSAPKEISVESSPHPSSEVPTASEKETTKEDSIVTAIPVATNLQTESTKSIAFITDIGNVTTESSSAVTTPTETTLMHGEGIHSTKSEAFITDSGSVTTETPSESTLARGEGINSSTPIYSTTHENVVTGVSLHTTSESGQTHSSPLPLTTEKIEEASTPSTLSSTIPPSTHGNEITTAGQVDTTSTVIESSTPSHSEEPTTEPFNPNPSLLASDNDPLVTVGCLSNGIKATFKLPVSFTGQIAAKDFLGSPNCFVQVSNSSAEGEHDDPRLVDLEIRSPHCGLNSMRSEDPKGVNQSIVLSVLHDKRLETAEDRSFIIQCFIPAPVPLSASHEEALETDLDVQRPQSGPMSKTISLEATPPKCKYALRRDSPNGAVIQTAQIGQVVYHRWECDGGKSANSAFGLHVHDCQAVNKASVPGNDSAPNYQIVDHNGCSADSSLFGEIAYSKDMMLAYVKAFVFTLRDVQSLRFQCKVTLCMRSENGCDGYSPPVCHKSNATSLEMLLTRRTRHYDLDAAMTTQIQTAEIQLQSPLISSALNGGGLIQQLRKFKQKLPPFVIVCSLLGAAILIGIILGVLCFLLTRGGARKRDEEERPPVSGGFSNNSAPTNERSSTPIFVGMWSSDRIHRVATSQGEAVTANSPSSADCSMETEEGVGSSMDGEPSRQANLRQNPSVGLCP